MLHISLIIRKTNTTDVCASKNDPYHINVGTYALNNNQTRFGVFTMHSFAKLPSPPLSVHFLSSCSNVYHKQEVGFLLYLVFCWLVDRLR